MSNHTPPPPPPGTLQALKAPRRQVTLPHVAKYSYHLVLCNCLKYSISHRNSSKKAELFAGKGARVGEGGGGASAPEPVSPITTTIWCSAMALTKASFSK